MITNESIQEVINRADIVDVVGQFVKLKKRGTNYIGNCPFHNEKSPSFNVNPARGIYKCFGCGKAGDVISFVEEYEKFNFTETIRWLAKYYHIDLQETAVSEDYKEHQRVEESLRIINEFAAQYFFDNLYKTEEGQLIGASYFKERGFSRDTIDKFKLGYSLDSWDAFYKTALQKGYDPSLLEKAGLVRVKEDGQLYDNYRGRAMFPIFSTTGKVIGFGARVLKTDGKQPKYVNTQENEVYVKNKVLYGLYQARQTINKLDECLLVEGYTDVVSLCQSGVTNVVASSGTALTEGQLKLIYNLTRNLTIIYDGDDAGIKAALRGLDKALGSGFNVKLVLLPKGEDPDSFVKQIGAEAFNTYLQENKQDVISFRLAVGLKDVGNDPIKKSQLVNEIAETIAQIDKIEDFALQEYYIKESSKKLQVEEQGLINLVNKYIRDKTQAATKAYNASQNTNITATAPPSGEMSEAEMLAFEAQMYMGEEAMLDQAIYTPVEIDNPIEWQLLRNLIEYGDKPFKDEGTVASVIFESLDPDMIENTVAKNIYHLIATHYEQNKQMPQISMLVNNQDKTIRERVANMLNVDYAPSDGWRDIVKIEVPFGEDIYESDIESIFVYYELKLVTKLLQDNFAAMEREKDPDALMKYMMVHQKLKQQVRDLEKFVIIK